MVAAFDSLFAATGMPVLSGMFGTAVTRITAAGSSSTVDAANVVSFYEDPSVEVGGFGKGVIRSGVLRLKDTQTMLVTDSYTIAGEIWRVVDVWHEAGGMRCGRLNTLKKETTNSAGGHRI